MGQAAKPEILERESGSKLLAPSAIPMSAEAPVPQEMNEADISDFIRDYVQATRNAVFKAGFDGVEVHAANGYLIPQFIEEGSNQRTDSWEVALKIGHSSLWKSQRLWLKLWVQTGSGSG